MPSMWTSFPSRRVVSRFMERMVRRGCVRVGCPALPAWLSSGPRACLLLTHVGSAPRTACMRRRAASTSPPRHPGGSAASPRLVPRRLHARDGWRTPQAPLLPGQGLGYQPLGRPHVSVAHGVGLTTVHRARFPGASRRGPCRGPLQSHRRWHTATERCSRPRPGAPVR